jgi:hypothetical protein
MGMSAEVIALGPYSEAIVGLMEYPAYYYASTKEGAPVTFRLFGIVEGSTASREFSELLGISDPWDFNQHKVDASKIDFEGLRRWVKRYPDYQAEVEVLYGLRRAGFEFHFRPEG